jgi:hypothetical protein
MSIYVVTHKNTEFRPMPGYRLIQAGAALHPHIEADCYDDSGDNISERNAFFCELTALYWIWKNTEDDVVGLVHYRRQFSICWKDAGILSYEEAEHILSRFEMILPQIAVQKCSMREEYSKSCGKDRDLERVRRIIEQLCPEYVTDYDAYLKGNITCYLNMMICKKELLDAYCRWLFPILFELEKQTTLSEYSDYQQRIFGFMGERLLNVWVRHNRVRVCHVFIIQQDRALSAGMRLIYRLARTVTYRMQMVFSGIGIALKRNER